MLCYLKIFATPMPITAQIFNNEFIKIIEFQILNPEGLIKSFVDENFSMKKLINGDPTNDKPSLLSELVIYAIIGVIFLIIVLLFSLLYFCKKFRAKVVEKLNKIKDKMIWNGIIMSVIVAYLKVMAAASTQIILISHG